MDDPSLIEYASDVESELRQSSDVDLSDSDTSSVASELSDSSSDTDGITGGDYDFYGGGNDEIEGYDMVMGGGISITADELFGGDVQPIKRKNNLVHDDESPLLIGDEKSDDTDSNEKSPLMADDNESDDNESDDNESDEKSPLMADDNESDDNESDDNESDEKSPLMADDNESDEESDSENPTKKKKSGGDSENSLADAFDDFITEVGGI
jgi:hypothetical protein